MNNSKNDYILEDVLYCQGPQGKAKNCAKGTFYYQFLMDKKDDEIQGENNFRAATDFAIYESLYIYLYNKGYLTDSKYCLDTTKINGGFCFTVDFGKLLNDVDIESELSEECDGLHYDEYIKTLCNPSDGFRCDVCGAISLSRHIVYDDNGNRIVHCLACYPLKSSLRKLIKETYGKNGTLDAVKQRLKIVSDSSKVRIAANLTPKDLVDDYKKEHYVSNASVKVKAIRQIFEKENIDYLEVFENDDYDIVIWNYQEVTTMGQFQKSVITNESGDRILMLLNNPDCVWLDDTAIDYAKSLTNDPFLKTLIES